jgi:branched-chain amino acid transport system substrate-binding protein
VRRLLWSSIFFTVVGIFSFSLPSGLYAENATTNHIRVGAIVDLTGPHAARGQLNVRGMEDYFRYVNETTSGISGRKIDLAVVDSGSDLADALEHTRAFCRSDKVDIAAIWNDHIFKKAKAIFVKHHIPHVDASDCRTILRPPVSYTYRPFGSTALDCYAILQYIETTHEGSAPPRIGILTTNDAFGKSIHTPSRAYASNHPLQIVAVEQFTPNTPDLKPAMLKLREMDAEYIFMQCAPSDAITALKSADLIDYNIPFFGAWTLVDAHFSDFEKSLIRNRLNVSFPGCLPGDGTSGINLLKILLERYRSVSGFHTAYWEGVSIAAIMARATQKAYVTLGKIDGPTVNLALETFENEDFGELIPNITYTDTNHSASFVTRIVRVNGNQTFRPLTTFWNPKTAKVTVIP